MFWVRFAIMDTYHVCRVCADLSDEGRTQSVARNPEERKAGEKERGTAHREQTRDRNESACNKKGPKQLII